MTHRRENEQTKLIIKDREAEVAEIEAKIAAEKAKPNKSCGCALI